MGRLGSDPSAGCVPLGEHLLGMWVAFEDDLALGESQGREPCLRVSDDVRATDAKALGAILLGELLGAPDLALDVAKGLAEGIGIADVLARAWVALLALAAGVDLEERVGASIGVAQMDGVTSSDASVKSVDQALSAALRVSDDDLYRVGKALAAGITLTDRESRALRAAIAAGLRLSDTERVGAQKAPEDGIGLADVSRRTMGKAMDDGVELSDAERRVLGKALIEALALSDASRWAAGKVSTDGIKLGDVENRAAGKALAETLVLSEASRWAAGKVTSDGIKLGDVECRVLGKALVEALVLSDARVSTVRRTIRDAVSASDAKRLGEIVMGDVLKAPDLAFEVGKGVADGVILTDVLARAWAVVRRWNDGVGLSDDAQLVLAIGLTLYVWSGELTLFERMTGLTLPDRRG